MVHKASPHKQAAPAAKAGRKQFTSAAEILTSEGWSAGGITKRDVAGTQHQLPAAIAQLDIALSNVEAYQQSIEERLERVLEPSDCTDEAKLGHALPADMRLADLVDCLTNRLRTIAAKQEDVLARLHV